MNNREFREYGKKLHESCETLMLVMQSKGWYEYYQKHCSFYSGGYEMRIFNFHAITERQNKMFDKKKLKVWDEK